MGCSTYRYWKGVFFGGRGGGGGANGVGVRVA